LVFIGPLGTFPGWARSKEVSNVSDQTSFEVRPGISADPLRELIAHLKAAVVADAAEIRAARPAVRRAQRAQAVDAPAQQSALARRRSLARAHHLVYGLLRAREWARLEPSHPDGDPLIGYLLARVWREATEAVAARIGVAPELPPALKRHLPRLRWP
jgi:hypothetical protein